MTFSKERLYILSLTITIFQELKLKAEIGRRLKKIRVERGLTQKEIASKVGIDFTYIGKIERGEQLPSLKKLIKIGDALSVPLCLFFVDEDMARVIEVCFSVGECLINSKKYGELIRSMGMLHADDIRLINEIIMVLNRHRKMSYESLEEPHQKAAEEEANYRKGKTKVRRET